MRAHIMAGKMFIRILPGLAASMLLGLAFYLVPSATTPVRRQARPERKIPEMRFPDPAFQKTGGGAFPRGNVAGVLREPSSPRLPFPAEKLPAPGTAPVPPLRKIPVKPGMKPVDATPHASAIQAMAPSGLRISPASPAVASDRGLASVQRDSAAVPYPDPPDKGVYLWAAGESFSGRQNIGDTETRYSHYRHDGTKVGLGLKYDWSIDGTAGVSVERLEQRVKSLRENDERRNNLTGHVFNARYDGTIMEKYPFDAGVFYGRVDNKGKGTAGGLDWREDKHGSELFGMSGKFGVPLEADCFGNVVKIMPTIGFAYSKLKSKSYAVDWDGVRFDVAKMNSTSMSVPVRVEIKKDFRLCWGLFSPRLSVGYTRELDAGATGVRILNASGGGMITDIDYGNRQLGILHDRSEKNFYDAGVGLDIQTGGGWELHADYVRSIAKKYAHDAFRLEVGKCF